MAKVPTEQAYHDGWLDGLGTVIDVWDTTYDVTTNAEDRIRVFEEAISELRKEVESDGDFSLDS